MIFNTAEGNRFKDTQFMMTSTTNAQLGLDFYAPNKSPSNNKFTRRRRSKTPSLRPQTTTKQDPPSSIITCWILLQSLLCFDILDYTMLTLCNLSFVLFKIYSLFTIFYYAWVCSYRYRHPILDPQMGMARMDPYIKEAIQIWCLFESLKDARTKRGMIAAITQYLQAHTKDSIPLYLYRKAMSIDYTSDWTSKDGHDQVEAMIDEAFGSQNIRESKDEILILEIQDGEIPWHVALDLAFNRWKEFRNSKVATKVTKFINIIVSAGMCSTANLSFKLGQVALFEPLVTKKQLAAGDIFEAFYEAASGFLKGGWRVYQSGELSAFFIEDGDIAKYETLYNDITSWHGYALAGNLLEYTDIDENEYENRLNQAITLGENLLQAIKRSQIFEYKYVSERNDRLRLKLTEFTQLRTRGGLRVSPFSISLFGRSGCGKSSLTDLTLKAGLIYNGLSAEKDRIATWADNDKFASTLRSHINAIVFDDFANTNEEFMDFSPAYRLIQVINNIRYIAPMADVFLKGKVSLNPYFCLISTNIEDLHAAKYSNEPESVLRRMYHVKVVPKPEYCEAGILSPSKIRRAFGQCACPDVWNLSVRRYTASNKRHIDLAAMIPVEFEGQILTDISVQTYLKWVQVASKDHFDEQHRYIANQEGVPEKCETCGLCYCNHPRLPVVEKAEKPEKPDLVKSDGPGNSRLELQGADDTGERLPILDKQDGYLDKTKCFAIKTGIVWSNVVSEIDLSVIRAELDGYFWNKADQLKHSFSLLTTNAVLEADYICTRWKKFDFIPERWICNSFALNFGLLFWRADIKRTLFTGYVGIIIFHYFIMIFAPFMASFSCILCIYYFTCLTIQTYTCMVREQILEAKDVVRTYLNRWQTKYALIGLGAIALVLYAMRKQHENTLKNSDDDYIPDYDIPLDRSTIASDIDIIEMHTGLCPSNIDEINKRNDVTNPWLPVDTAPLPMSEPAKTTVSSNLAESMKTNIIGIVSDLEKVTLAFYITSNFLLIPQHFIDAHGKRDIPIRCYRSGNASVGSYFNDKLCVAYSAHIPATDFTICFVTGGGSMKDYRKFLPLDTCLKKTEARLVTREIIDTKLTILPTLFKGSTVVTHTAMAFVGGYYKLADLTKPGMCMSPLVSAGKGSMILGFHLGGKKYIGGCGIITQVQVDVALQELSRRDGIVLSASSGTLRPDMGDFPLETLGHQILQNTEIHQRSAARFLTEGACCEVYGGIGGQATPYSSVRPTVISKKVAEVFGVPQQWGAPKLKGKGRYPYQATLVHAALPSLPLGSVLAKSVRSVKGTTAKVKKTIPELFRCGPLSRVATVSGLTGVKFIDAMNFTTSPGFPLSGPKSSLLVDLDPEEYPECGKPRTFVPEIWDEFDKIVSTLRSGKRCYMIWKSCLKDEATKLTKDKVRVFQSAPLVLQLLIRMYFLPLVRIIQMNPIAFECAVGVNAEGLEWQELWEAAMSKGAKRVLAGDYSKYDVRMPAQVTIAAFDILIDMAEQCEGYTPEDIHIMKMVVHEVVYPFMAYNGDLIQLFGTNPSGQNLTVIINSLVNSLLLRGAFFTKYPDKDFKEECAFITYGDDVMGTVSENCPEFTHITYAEYLAQHDMKFTMPDKESTPVHYMNENDVDFLKRKCVFNEDLGCKVGILSEDSIYKRLHAHILSKELTLPMHSAQNIETSLHDWFFYGREVFEDRQQKLKKVATECDIDHLCPALGVSYDKRVNRWRHKYLGEDLDIEEEDQEIRLE
jgi:hypothetical protein